ncbi:hypothetical protein EIN_205290 [Entamoeba invadens IP1]|uniref:Uncharacterized protein n=1 Tax=Entamoeba invadens IP1 TaxID=370355 RepID=A0A0A1U9B4_ENTIV|nr:hypothetical protein EIN_205290 [Entamoeba invadens IP1]ELP91612.1 hypothetical protein EIN_205290 [Entamoeba invadens IP1]|eukprot:XP_004258383.1 hypothetical protein EIN_205290 [Entamoeba invadens IP1]
MDAEASKIKSYIDSQGNFVIFHDLYVKLLHLIGGPRDLHLSLTLDTFDEKKIGGFIVVNPTSFSFKGTKAYVNVPASIFGNPVGVIFNTLTVSNLKSKMTKNIAIKTINGVEAVKFIRDYAMKYFLLKNENGAVTQLKSEFTIIPYYANPVDIADTTFNLVFEDNSEISFNSKLFNQYAGFTGHQDKFKRAKEILQKYREEISARNKKERGRVIYRAPDRITEDLFVNKKEADTLYNVTLNRVLSCGIKTYNNKKYNIMSVFSFNSNGFDEFVVNAKKCGELFDTNTDPIVVFLPMNGGGYIDAENYLYNILSPNTNYEKRSVGRINPSTEKVLRNGFGYALKDPITNQYWMDYSANVFVGPLGDWYDKPQSEMYGSTQFTHFSESILVGNSTIYKTKNIRKWNEIVVFSDHFCYSACSIFTKNFVEKKSAIVATYSGLPNSQFRAVGESPTAVIQDYSIHNGEETILSDLGITLGLSFLPTLPLDKSNKVPSEYLVHQPNDYVEIGEFQNTAEGIDVFLEQANLLMQKYSSNCENGKVTQDAKCTKNSESEIWGIKCVNGEYLEANCVFMNCSSGYVRDTSNTICYKKECENSDKVVENSECPKTSTSESWGIQCVNNKKDVANCKFIECKTGYKLNTTTNKCDKIVTPVTECKSGETKNSVDCKETSESSIYAATCVNGKFDYTKCVFSTCQSGYEINEKTSKCEKVVISECLEGESKVDISCKETSETEIWAAKCVNGKFDNTQCKFIQCKGALSVDENGKCSESTKCTEGSVLQSEKCKDQKENEIWVATCENGKFDFEKCQFLQCKEGFQLDEQNKCVKIVVNNSDQNDGALSYLECVLLALLLVI